MDAASGYKNRIKGITEESHQMAAHFVQETEA